jgi:hypothetical protein
MSLTEFNKWKKLMFGFDAIPETFLRKQGLKYNFLLT